MAPQSLLSCPMGHAVARLVAHWAPSGLGRPGAGH
jgi:hypothetical protein